MSVIANFAKRRAARKDQAASVKKAHAENVIAAPENEALILLAKLLGCEVESALEQARELVELGCEVVALEADLTDEQTQKIFAKSSPQDQAATLASAVELSTAELNDSADSVAVAADSVKDASDSVNQAATSVEESASDLNNTSSDLAYSADSIGAATAELKEATADLKKPSAGPKSSRGARTSKAKSSSKK